MAANKSSGRKSPAQSRERSKCSEGKGFSIPAASTSDKNERTSFQKGRSNVSMPVRSSAERWNNLVRSGLVRGASVASLAVSSTSSTSLSTLPTTRYSPGDPSLKTFVRVATQKAPSLHSTGGALGVTHRQQRPSAGQQEVSFTPTSRAAQGLQISTPAAAESADERYLSPDTAATSRSFLQVQKTPDALCASDAEAEAAAAAFFRSNAAVPPQLLALFGALAGTSSSGPPTVCLSCHKWKKNDESDQAVASEKLHHIVSAPHADSAFSPAQPAAHGYAGPPWQKGKVDQHGEKRVTPTENLCSRHRAPAATDLGRESERDLLYERTTCDYTNGAVAHSAAASVSLADKCCRAVPLPRERSTGQPPPDACNEEAVDDATPPDLLSAALCRTTTSLAVEALTRQESSISHMPSLQRVNAENVVTPEKRRHGKQRDARFIAGSMRAALAVVGALRALHILKPTAYAASSLEAAEAFTPATTAEQGRLHSKAASVPSCLFCLPCAALRHHNHKLPIPSSSHSFAAATFILPFPERPHRVAHPEVSAVRRRKEAAVGRGYDSTSPCNKNRGGLYERASTPSVEKEDAPALPRHSRKTHRDCAAGESYCCCPCGLVCDSSGCLEKDHGRICRAVWVHLGMLYTAADVAASATAAAAGKSQRQAQTTAAITRASARVGEAQGTAPSALGSVLLRRALSTNLLEPLRAQTLLQRQQVQKAERDLVTMCAGGTESEPNAAEDDGFLPLSGTQAATLPPHQEVDPFQPSCIHNVKESAVLRSDSEGGPLAEEERGTGQEKHCDAGADETGSVILCCFDGIEQLQLCQWKQAVSVLDAVLSEIVEAAAIHAQQERLKRAMSHRVVLAERRGVCLKTNTFAGINNTKSRTCTADDRLTGARTVHANPTMDSPSICRTSSATGILLLLLWKQSQLEASERLQGTPGAAKVSQKALWEDVSLWRQQVQQAYPGVQVLLASDEDDMEAEACSGMLQYLTNSNDIWRNKVITNDFTQQQLPRESGEQQQTQLLVKPKRRPQDREPEPAAHYYKEQNALCHDPVQERYSLQGSQCQNAPPQRSAETRPDKKQSGTAEQDQHEERNGASYAKTCEDICMAQGGTMLDRGKQGIHTGTASSGACMINMNEHATSESEASELRRLHIHNRRNRIRQHDVLKRPKKEVSRPCMLFLCGQSFMAAPLLSEGRSWRKMMSCFPLSLRKFVRELEEHVYIPMMLRSRLVASGASRAAPRRTVASTGHSNAVAASTQDKTERLLRKCERLLRWGDELFPPPRILVHSCDITGRRGCSSRRDVTPQWRDWKRTATTPLDAGVSPQQLLQLVGEKYSGAVQTFLLPVAALASSFVGQTEEKLRRLLRAAAAAAPAVLVLLGLDHLAARRRLQNPGTYKQRTKDTFRQPKHEKRPGNAMQVYFEESEKCELRQTGQATEAGPPHDHEFRVQAQGAFQGRIRAAKDDYRYERPLSRVKLARRVVGGERCLGKHVGEAKQNIQTACCLPELRINGSPCGENMHTAGSVGTIASGDSEERTGISDAVRSELEGNDGDTDEEIPRVDNRREGDTEESEEELKFDSRRGTAATSSLRRRLLATLLVGLDDIENRRSCNSALLSADDPWHATAADEADGEVAAERKLAREWHVQQAGLAVVGVCGGHPEALDEAVVRAGRLDVWLSWPQHPASSLN